jgi:hypothetical protein
MPVDDALTTTTASSSKSNQTEALIGTLKEYTSQTLNSFEEFSQRSTDMRQRMMDMQSQQSAWEEYERLSEKVLSLATKKSPETRTLLSNLCKRVRSLEETLGIDKSASVAADCVKIWNSKDDDDEDSNMS